MKNTKTKFLNFQNLRILKKTFLMLIALTLFLVVACSGAPVIDESAEQDQVYEAAVEETGTLEDSIVDPDLESELDSINLDDW